jgi:flavodoxin
MKMRSLLVYSSLTGNTKKVAEAIMQIMPPNTDICTVESAPPIEFYDFIILGFWVKRGKPDAKMLEFIKGIKGKKVAFFSTLGAYPDSEHAISVIKDTTELLEQNNKVLGSFICQGKIHPKLTESINNLPTSHHHAMTPERLARHQEASKHPDENDLTNAQQTFKRILKGCE